MQTTGFFIKIAQIDKNILELDTFVLVQWVKRFF